jgi:hypothetical protein
MMAIVWEVVIECPGTKGLDIVERPKPDIDVGQLVERASKHPIGVLRLPKGE